MPIATFLGAGGGDPTITSFSDPLTTIDPNSNTGMGQDWIQGNHVNLPNTGNAIVMTAAKIAVTGFDGANGLVMSFAGNTGAGEQYRLQLIPIKKGIYTNLFGKTQFSQITFLQSSNNSWSGGPSVCCYPADEGMTQYGVRLNSLVATTWLLQRGVASTFTNLASGTDTLTGGDVFRLSADMSVAGQVTLTFKQNGTVRTTFTDTNASRITIGVPGLFCNTPGPAGTVEEFRTFSCGLGL